ncbi:MAG: response regulator, partial [Kofleriaceae bacterium]
MRLEDGKVENVHPLTWRSAALASPSPSAVPARGRILVVEDELAILRAYARALSGGGYEVTQATDGERAYEIAKSQRFHAIVSDVGLPGMTGLELLRAVRQHDLDVPVILLT